MIYLQSFTLPTASQEEDFFLESMKAKRTCYTSKYPFGLFRYRNFPEFFFDDVTIFYGNNGSGKSTVLNVIAEKLDLNRDSLYNRSNFFKDYTNLCQFETESPIPLIIPLRIL